MYIDISVPAMAIIATTIMALAIIKYIWNYKEK